ncbi:MAG: hypothetical protein PHV36_15150 [Elusimicrobiales bacterium]|nr:hypothetical protein [Elusimicrobiales bacterium]
MTKKDKIIAAFLVSMGLFTAFQVAAYISTLTTADKKSLFSAVKKSHNGAIYLLCDGDWPTTNPKKS